MKVVGWAGFIAHRLQYPAWAGEVCPPYLTLHPVKVIPGTDDTATIAGSMLQRCAKYDKCMLHRGAALPEFVIVINWGFTAVHL